MVAKLIPMHMVTAGGTTVVASSSLALESAPGVTTLVSQSTGAWMLQGRGSPICTAWGRLAAGASWLSCVLLASACPGGSAGSWAVSPGALGSGVCAAGIALPGPCSPLHDEPPPEPQPQLLLGPCRACSRPLGSSAAVCGTLYPGAHLLITAPGSLGASLSLLGSCPSSL